MVHSWKTLSLFAGHSVEVTVGTVVFGTGRHRMEQGSASAHKDSHLTEAWGPSSIELPKGLSTDLCVIKSGMLEVVLAISKGLVGSEGGKRSLLTRHLGRPFNPGSQTGAGGGVSVWT